ARITAPDKAAGRQAKCPKCGITIMVPPLEEVAASSPAQVAASVTQRQQSPIDRKANLDLCPDCGKEVSKRATQCPHCGCPLAATGSALTTCKACRARVAESAQTCPNCGVSNPGSAVGKLVIMRSSAMAGAMYVVRITVDGQPAGEVKDGATVTLELP